MATKAKGSRSRKRPRDDSPQLLETTLSSQDAVKISNEQDERILTLDIGKSYEF